MPRIDAGMVIVGLVGMALVGCGTPATVSAWRTQAVTDTAGLQQAAFGAIARAQADLQAAHDAASAGNADAVIRNLKDVRRVLQTQADFAAAFPQKATIMSEYVQSIDRAIGQVDRALGGSWIAANSMDYLVTDVVAPLQKGLTSVQLQLMH